MSKRRKSHPSKLITDSDKENADDETLDVVSTPVAKKPKQELDEEQNDEDIPSSVNASPPDPSSSISKLTIDAAEDEDETPIFRTPRAGKGTPKTTGAKKRPMRLALADSPVDISIASSTESPRSAIKKSSNTFNSMRSRQRAAAAQLVKDYENNAPPNTYPMQTVSIARRKDLILDKSMNPRDDNVEGEFDPNSDLICVICHKGSTTEEPLISCHGQMNGEKIEGERYETLQKKHPGNEKYANKPFVPCRSKFHAKCMMEYNAGGFRFLYSARVECQGLMLCPLHACASCYIHHHKQSAYVGNLIECVKCLRAFHLETCYPGGGNDLDVFLKVKGHRRQFEMMICPSHDEEVNGEEMKPMTKHIRACYNSECTADKKSSLINCKTCVRSFHLQCRETEQLDGVVLNNDTCDHCLCHDIIHKDAPVLAIFSGKFHPALLRDFYVYPNTGRLSEPNFERVGFAAVQWHVGNQTNIIPIREIVQYQPNYEHLLPKSMPAQIRKAWLDNYALWSMSSAPGEYYKIVQKTGTVAKYHPNTDPIYKRYDRAKCSCQGAIRCVDERCETVHNGCECPPYCPPGCQNQKLKEQYVNPKLEHRKTKGKGLGVFATDTIFPGEYLTEYVGWIIHKKEKDIRMARLRDSGDFQANHYMLDMKDGLSIDAVIYGNISRYINHSCMPNAESEVLHKYIKSEKKNDVDVYAERNVIRASRLIKKDEEITFSYAMTASLGLPNCKCGTPLCDGFLTAKQDNAVREAWAAHDAAKGIVPVDAGKSMMKTPSPPKENKKKKGPRKSKILDEISPKKFNTAPTRTRRRDPSEPCSSAQAAMEDEMEEEEEDDELDEMPQLFTPGSPEEQDEDPPSLE